MKPTPAGSRKSARPSRRAGGSCSPACLRTTSGAQVRVPGVCTLTVGCLLALAAVQMPTADPGVACAEPGRSIAASLRGRGIVVFGETHGTQESPALVADLACHLAAHGRVLVGMEIPRWLNRDLAAFIDGDLDAKTLVTAARPTEMLDGTPLQGSEQKWWHVLRDGRTGYAMLDLLTRVRELVTGGREIDVFAFDDAEMWFEGEDAPAYTRDELMARNVARELDARAYKHVLILAGGSHAQRSSNGRKRTMVDWLAASDVFSVRVRFKGGMAWNCPWRPAAANALPGDCGVHSLPDLPEDTPLARLSAVQSGSFDAEIVLPKATPSPPVGGGWIYPSHP